MVEEMIEECVKIFVEKFNMGLTGLNGNFMMCINF